MEREQQVGSLCTSHPRFSISLCNVSILQFQGEAVFLLWGILDLGHA